MLVLLFKLVRIVLKVCGCFVLDLCEVESRHGGGVHVLTHPAKTHIGVFLKSLVQNLNYLSFIVEFRLKFLDLAEGQFELFLETSDLEVLGLLVAQRNIKFSPIT
jgi:hypothetical protein